MTTEVTPVPTEGAPSGTEVSTTPSRPENVPEKFWNAETGSVNTEALLASYAEAEKRLSSPPEAVPAEVPPTPDAPVTVTNTAAYEAAVAKATEELAQGDAISDETYAALEQSGVSRTQVDTYVAGQRAMFELRTMQVSAEVGGSEQYEALLAWAVAGNYSQDEASAFNTAVFGADKNAALDAARTLQKRYNDAMGTEGRMVMGQPANTAPGGYATKSEWLADIRKPEYKTDPGFRSQVEKKLHAAIRNGVPLGVSVSMR